MPAKHDFDYAAQLALWLDESIGPHNGDPATIATSELGSWQVDECIKSDIYYTTSRRTHQVVKKLVRLQTHQFKYYDKKPLLPSVKLAEKIGFIGTAGDSTAHGTIDEVTRITNDIGTHSSVKNNCFTPR